MRHEPSPYETLHVMTRSLLWFRRDLRLEDHAALAAAAAAGDVVPVFVVDPLFTARAGAPRRAFMAAALRALNDEMGGALVYRHGDPATVIPELAAEVGASAVYVSRDFGPYGRRRDAAVAARLSSDGRRLVGVGSPYAVEPGTVTKADGTPYAVFTPFSKAWRSVGWGTGAAEATARITVNWSGAPGVPCDGPPLTPQIEFELPDASAASTYDRWRSFVHGRLDRYDVARNEPAASGTSTMSAALRWGIIHPRQMLGSLAPYGDVRAHDVFASELAWREFYADVLFRRPESAWQNLQSKMGAMPIDTDDRATDRFAAWQRGETGYPIVDAGMRELLATGWMHNRVRMITASFLIKDLHLPWQWGARHFMRHLIDGDLASNAHGWQWTAGTGTDAAPYFRVFNPTSQSERFDPDGGYIRRWVPELTSVAGSLVHAPGLLRPDSYPAPIVDHAIERDEALRRYRAVTGATR